MKILKTKKHLTDVTEKPTGTTTRRWHLSFAALSAVLLGLAFPPISWSSLAYICLMPLGILSVCSLKPVRLAWCTWLVFFVWWLVMVRWMVPVTVGGYIAMSAFFALYPMVFALAIYLISKKQSIVPMTLALPAVWVSLEFARGIVPFGGFAWFTLAATAAPFLPDQGAGHIIQVADLFGEYTVSFVVAMTSGFLVDLLTLPLMRRVKMTEKASEQSGQTVYGTRLRKTICFCFALWLAVLLASFFYGGYRIAEFDQVTTPALRVTLVQTNVPQSNKMSPSQVQQNKNWNHLLGLTQQAASVHPKPDLIVWPETMSPAPLNSSAQKIFADVGSSLVQYRKEISAFTKLHHIAILAGASTMDDWQLVQTPDGRSRYVAKQRYNSAYLFSSGGQLSGRYDKIHLVPFGEYIPVVESMPALKKWFIHTLSPYGFDYTTDAGHQVKIFHLPRVADKNGAASKEALNLSSSPATFATPICFEDTVAALCRSMVYRPNGNKRSNLLINMTNDGWFAQTSEPQQHAQLAALRCIENRVPMARCVNTGPSSFIDSLGRVQSVVVADGKHTDVAGLVSHTMRQDSRVTLYSKLGQLPVTILALLALAWVIINLLLVIRHRRTAIKTAE